MKNFINIIEILGDLKDLQRKIYLDSPEVFVDFVDKINDNQLDEMVLFYATKYDYLSIVEFIVSNKIVDLNSPSKNTQFPTIKDHILAAASQFNARDIYDYILNYNETESSSYAEAEDELEAFLKNIGERISGLYDENDATNNYYSAQNDQDTEESQDNQEKTEEEVEDTNEANAADTENTQESDEENVNCEDVDSSEGDNKPNVTSNYYPTFICPNCNTNIFETGYSTSEKVNYKYSKEENGVKAISKEQENAVTCLKCGYTIEQLNPAFLENICTIQNCKKCGRDLTSTGIVTKMKTEYDNESNSFITSKKTYHCAECDNELTDYQVNYFKL